MGRLLLCTASIGRRIEQGPRLGAAEARCVAAKSVLESLRWT